MPLGPQTADLTRLSGLRVLHLVQINSMATPLLPPDLALLPHLQLYQLLNSCGAIQLQVRWLPAAGGRLVRVVCDAVACCPRALRYQMAGRIESNFRGTATAAAQRSR